MNFDDLRKWVEDCVATGGAYPYSAGQAGQMARAVLALCDKCDHIRDDSLRLETMLDDWDAAIRDAIAEAGLPPIQQPENYEHLWEAPRFIRQLQARVAELELAREPAVIDESRWLDCVNEGAEAFARQLLADDGRGVLNDGPCNEATQLLRRLKARVAEIEELVRHCWVHSGYADCGSDQMTTEQRRLYRSIIDATETGVPFSDAEVNRE